MAIHPLVSTKTALLFAAIGLRVTIEIMVDIHGQVGDSGGHRQFTQLIYVRGKRNRRQRFNRLNVHGGSLGKRSASFKNNVAVSNSTAVDHFHFSMFGAITLLYVNSLDFGKLDSGVIKDASWTLAESSFPGRAF